jgi:hypothetical protein
LLGNNSRAIILWKIPAELFTRKIKVFAGIFNLEAVHPNPEIITVAPTFSECINKVVVCP